jgi:hypothetical protein
MAYIEIKIDLDNDCFASDPEIEVARILRQAAADYMTAGTEVHNSLTLRDLNGNTVGSAILYIE